MKQNSDKTSGQNGKKLKLGGRSAGADELRSAIANKDAESITFHILKKVINSGIEVTVDEMSLMQLLKMLNDINKKGVKKGITNDSDSGAETLDDWAEETSTTDEDDEE